MTMIILETCGLWDIDYNSDNWELEFMTIFVIWQLIVTLDSIRSSCDVLLTELNLSVSLAGLAAFLIFLPESNWSVSLAAFLNFYFLFGRI